MTTVPQTIIDEYNPGPDDIAAVEAIRGLFSLPPGTVGTATFDGASAAFVRTSDAVYRTLSATDGLESTYTLLRDAVHGAAHLDARGAPRVDIVTPGSEPAQLAEASADAATHPPQVKQRIASAMEAAPIGSIVMVGDVVHPSHSAALDLWFRRELGWSTLPCGPQYDLDDADDESLYYLVMELGEPAPEDVRIVAPGRPLAARSA